MDVTELKSQKGPSYSISDSSKLSPVTLQVKENDLRMISQMKPATCDLGHYTNSHQLNEPSSLQTPKILETKNLLKNETEYNSFIVRFSDNVMGKEPSEREDDDHSICDSKDDEDDDDDEEKYDIPDGGWGWIVVLSSFLISMIADGISFSFGLLQYKFEFIFEESKAVTAWIGSIFLAVPLLAGPIGSALVDHYGCRAMTIVGGVVSGTGFFFSAFVNSIPTLCITLSVIGGLGLGLCYVTAVVSICYWFDKKRTLATGLGACGTGLGTTVYAPMVKHFIAEYGWRGCVIILSGTLLNICVCGSVMREPEWWILEESKASKLPKKKASRSSSVTTISGRSGDLTLIDTERVWKQMKSKEAEEYIVAAEKADCDTSTSRRIILRSAPDLPTFVRQNEAVPLDTLELLRKNSKKFRFILENISPEMLVCRSISDNTNFIAATDTTSVSPTPVTMKVTKNENELPPAFNIPSRKIKDGSMLQEGSKQTNTREKKKENAAVKRTPASQKTRQQQDRGFVRPLHYLHRIRVHRNQIMYRGATLNINRYRLRASSCPDIYKNSMTTIALETDENWYDDILEVMKGMVDFSMFLELHFLIVSVSTTLLFTWFVIMYLYLPDLMSDYGYNEHMDTFLSMVGFTNFIGMIVLGWAGDQKWINVPFTYGICLILCGLFIFLIPLIATEFYILGTCCALFGLFFASSFSFTPVILVQLISIERFSTGYGLILLCQGIGNLIGPPIGGWLGDITGTCDITFYVAGAGTMLAGVLITLIPFTKNHVLCKCQTKDDEKDYDDSYSI